MNAFAGIRPNFLRGGVKTRPILNFFPWRLQWGLSVFQWGSNPHTPRQFLPWLIPWNCLVKFGINKQTGYASDATLCMPADARDSKWAICDSQWKDGWSAKRVKTEWWGMGTARWLKRVHVYGTQNVRYGGLSAMKHVYIQWHIQGGDGATAPLVWTWIFRWIFALFLQAL